jgi:MFS family permease
LGLIFACLVFSIGVAFQTAATALPLFVVGRVVAGLGVGLVSCLVPMYQSECSPKWIRGAVVSCYQWAITIGLLLAACANEGQKDKPDASGYRWVVAIQFFWGGILAGGMFFLPESPRYLIKRGRFEKARKNLARVLRADIDSAEVKAEYEEIEANLRHEESIGQTSYLDCFRNGPGHNRLRVLTGIFLQAWQQLTGINVHSLFYSSDDSSFSTMERPFSLKLVLTTLSSSPLSPTSSMSSLLFLVSGQSITSVVVNSSSLAQQECVSANTSSQSSASQPPEPINRLRNHSSPLSVSTSSSLPPPGVHAHGSSLANSTHSYIPLRISLIPGYPS